MAQEPQPTVLIVEDEPDVAETYEMWLGRDYDVRHAADGESGLAALEAGDIDVVLLDRMLPDIAGSEVLEAIRERGYDCRVAMVTAVDPGFDVVEMGFDEYIVKPPEGDQLRDVIERLLERADLSPALQEYESLVARRSALEAELTASELESSDQYDELLERIEAARTGVDETVGDMSDDMTFVGAVREIAGDGESEESAGAEPDDSDTGRDSQEETDQ